MATLAETGAVGAKADRAGYEKSVEDVDRGRKNLEPSSELQNVNHVMSDHSIVALYGVAMACATVAAVLWIYERLSGR